MKLATNRWHVVAVAVLLSWLPCRAAEPLRLCATLPDLADLAQAVGGDDVRVTTFVKGTEDPHFIEARPSFVKLLSTADALIYAGLELEIGWLPVLVRNSRNASVTPGGPGDIDASRAIAPLEIPVGNIDRSRGDVHALGNPHYLLDPMNGLKVAALLRDRLAALRPASRPSLEARFAALRSRIAAGLVGERLATMYDIEKLMVLHDHGKLEVFLQQQKHSELLGGWLAAMRPHRGKRVIADHRMWPYFARRFGVEIVDYLEPKPGVAPTTSHLGRLLQSARDQAVAAVVTGPYFDPRHARFISDRTGIPVAVLAHQVHARPQAVDYVAMFGDNIERLSAAFAAPRQP